MSFKRRRQLIYNLLRYLCYVLQPAKVNHLLTDMLCNLEKLTGMLTCGKEEWLVLGKGHLTEKKKRKEKKEVQRWYCQTNNHCKVYSNKAVFNEKKLIQSVEGRVEGVLN